MCSHVELSGSGGHAGRIHPPLNLWRTVDSLYFKQQTKCSIATVPKPI